jgi:GT2 family glycosyltransferase
VPSHRADAVLGRCLDAIAGQTERDREVIVVESSPTDVTRALVARAGARLVIDPDPGAAPKRNRGVAEARSDRIAFTDADCLPEPDWLERGIEALGRADLVQGQVEPEAVARRLPFDRTLSVTRQTPFFETANMFVTRRLFERVGGFEAPFGDIGGRPFGEDVLFGWRARRLGGRIAFSPEARVRHVVFRSGMGPFVAEHWRRRMFPAMVARLPEMRGELCFARLFLDSRSAAFDAALAGGAGALALRRPEPLAAALPYAWLSLRDALPWRSRAPERLAGAIAADAVGCAALVVGSLRARTPVL